MLLSDSPLAYDSLIESLAASPCTDFKLQQQSNALKQYRRNSIQLHELCKEKDFCNESGDDVDSLRSVLSPLPGVIRH